MVWGGIRFHCRTTLVHIAGTMSSRRYISQIWEPMVLPYIQCYSSAIFQQDNSQPHVAWNVQEYQSDCITSLAFLFFRSITNRKRVIYSCKTTAPGYSTPCYIISILAICGSHMDCCT
ncbi:uncharacterized protein TNCV_4400011 [Trichonephila clavipes]|nr:uncharacterized protein TNCV_4400011 [Trichonephila clavipes]